VSTFGTNALPKPPTNQRPSYSKLRLMRKDSTISLARQLVVAPVLASPWSIEAEQDAPPEAKEFINSQMQPMRMHLLRTGMYGCIDFGWQPYEKVFKYDEATGHVVIHKLKPLLQDITDILVEEANGAYKGLKQESNGNVTLEVEDSLLLNIDVEGTYWYGQGLLENCEDPYDDWNAANISVKRYDNKVAGANWVVHYPIGTSMVNGVETDNFKVAKTFIAALEGNGAIAIPRRLSDLVDDLNKDSPDAWHIELLGDSSPKQYSQVARFKYLDALKVRALGLPERAVLEGQFGTKAEAEAHADLAITNMELRHKTLVQLINWHLVNQLLRLNFGQEAENKVYIEPAPIADLALQYLRSIYVEIIKNPDGFLQEFEHIDFEALKDRLGVPILSKDDVDAPGFTSELVPGK